MVGLMIITAAIFYLVMGGISVTSGLSGDRHEVVAILTTPLVFGIRA